MIFLLVIDEGYEIGEDLVEGRNRRQTLQSNIGRTLGLRPCVSVCGLGDLTP